MDFLQNLSGKAKAIGATVIVGLILLIGGVVLFSDKDDNTTNVGAIDSNIDYNLASNIQDGVILHCFNWKYTDIKAELKNIAAAGFTSVQTSPAQISVNSGWWNYLYQPMGFSIGTNDLGTKGELKELCEEADKYGIKVIVDVVANHLADDPNIQSDLRDEANWHTFGMITEFKDRYQITHGNVEGMPDLNHENSYIQQVVSNYINELKDIGVDGIRWDSAKNISLPSEGSTFWLGVTSQGLYHYGAITNGPDDRIEGNENLMIEYTEYMSVTDNVYGKELRDAFSKGAVPLTDGNWSKKGITKDKLVYWGENHESWSNNGAFGYSNGMTQNVIDRAYAIAASQSGSTALYFSRPDSSVSENIYAGKKGSTHFMSAEVTSINHFHNAMKGQKDAYATGQNCAVVGREKGAVIVAGKEADIYVTVPNPDGVTMPGTYKDVLTGQSWVVTSTTITGTIGSTGIAVIYGELVAPIKPENSEDPNNEEGATISGDSDTPIVTEGKIYYKNKEKWEEVYAYYWSKDNENMCQWPGQKMTDIGENVFSVELPAGCEYIVFSNGDQLKTLNITLAGAGKLYYNGYWSDFTEPEREPEPITPVVTQGAVFFKNTENWNRVMAYYWSSSNPNMTKWPGEDMILVDGDIYGITVPEGTEFIIFNNGDAIQTADIPLQGANKLYTDGQWSDYEGTIPEEPEVDIEFEGNIFFKNTSKWSKVNIYYWSSSDLSMVIWPGEEMNYLGGDIYGYTIPEDAEMVIFTDGSSQTADITLEGFNKVYVAGKWVSIDSKELGEIEEEQYIYYKNTTNWGTVCAYYWSNSNSKMIAWPGVEMESVGDGVFRVQVPAEAGFIIFSNGYGDQTEDIELEGMNKIYIDSEWKEYN